MKPVYFKSPGELRGWLEENHSTAAELLIGFHKRATGKPSLTWPQLVDQVLCFGWIDGVRRRVDDARWTIRITPRKPDSIWSAINLQRVAELSKQGMMTPCGLAAFERRTRSKVYSYEQREEARFSMELDALFRANRKAFDHFQSCPPGYRRTATFWATNAKREETRAKRMQLLIACCEQGRRLDDFLRKK